jgi:hypothetical protein
MRASCADPITGWSIKSWRDGDSIPLFVNKVYSDNTQIQYAFSELPFVCPPSGRQRAGTGLISGSNVALNLGEVLRGDRITVSDYELEMGKDDEAHYLCSQKVDRAGLKKAIEVVKHGYVAEWIVDNLPGATSFVTVDRSRKYYASGFKMGYEDVSPTNGRPRYFINNMAKAGDQEVQIHQAAVEVVQEQRSEVQRARFCSRETISDMFFNLIQSTRVYEYTRAKRRTIFHKPSFPPQKYRTVP